MVKKYRLLDMDGFYYESSVPGKLGGNSKLRIYGKLDCSSAISALPKGYSSHRVFFSNESEAIGAGYRPCANCMKDRYKIWKSGGALDSANYPWLQLPGHL